MPQEHQISNYYLKQCLEAYAGVQALSWLLAVPGASHTVLDARVPYAPAAMAELLGAMPEIFASPGTAAAMARAAYRQAAQLAALGEPLVGLGCTCALATDRPKQGQHKAWPLNHHSYVGCGWGGTCGMLCAG